MSLEKKGHLLGKTHPLLPQGAMPDPVEIIRTGKGAAAFRQGHKRVVGWGKKKHTVAGINGHGREHYCVGCSSAGDLVRGN